METMTAFSLELQRADVLMSWDVRSGYRHFYLHPDMRDLFLFRYYRRYHQCIALPFGWRRSVLWFTKLLRPLVSHLRDKLDYYIFPTSTIFCWLPCLLDASRRRRIARKLVPTWRGNFSGWD